MTRLGAIFIIYNSMKCYIYIYTQDINTRYLLNVLFYFCSLVLNYSLIFFVTLDKSICKMNVNVIPAKFHAADAVLKLLITTCKKFAFLCYSKLDG